jgi:hypothetical protein
MVILIFALKRQSWQTSSNRSVPADVQNGLIIHLDGSFLYKVQQVERVCSSQGKMGVLVRTYGLCHTFSP